MATIRFTPIIINYLRSINAKVKKTIKMISRVVYY